VAVWDIKERYDLVRSNEATRGDIGMTSSSQSATFEKVQISTTGNAVSFGNLNTSDYNGGGVSGSQTRIVHGGGNQPSFSNAISYKEFSHSGNFSDFGNLTTGRQMLTSASNGNMAVFMGGRTPSASNVIDRIGFSTLGDAVDFGDLTVARFGASAMQSPTRAIFAGGGAPTNVIDFIDFASFGNATDFGDIGSSSYYNYFAGSSSDTRGVFGGGGNPSNTSIINFVTMASTGDSQDFGDLTVSRITMSAAGNSNRICFFSGQQTPAPAPGTDVIDYITIATTGNATDFGDTSESLGFKTGGGSNGHGGLKLDNFQRPSATYMPGSGRGLILGGSSPGIQMDLIHIPTLGNASDFGDLTIDRNGTTGASSLTRGFAFGGVSPSKVNSIECFEFQSLGNPFDFGDLSAARSNMGSGHGSTTRALCFAGLEDSGPFVNTIEYITMATVGNVTDFGDATASIANHCGTGSITRAVMGGGMTPEPSNIIDYVTIASTGDATDFGDLSAARGEVGAVSNSTRGIYGGGRADSTGNDVDIIEYVTISSTGNTTDFGDLSVSRRGDGAMGGLSNSIRGVFAGGYDQSPGAYLNTMDYITIASTGDATDFGDLTTLNGTGVGSASDSHGGLQG